MVVAQPPPLLVHDRPQNGRPAVAKWPPSPRWPSPTGPLSTSASTASEARRASRDYQSTPMNLEGERRAADQMSGARPSSRRPSAGDDTFKCGRRVRRDMRPALAAPYQVTPRGPNSRRAYLHILPTWPVLAAVSAAESDAIKRQGVTNNGSARRQGSDVASFVPPAAPLGRGGLCAVGTLPLAH